MGGSLLHARTLEGNVDTGTVSFARILAGRIVEVHVRRLADVGDVAALHAQVVNAIRRAGPRAVLCADHRLVSPLSRDVADVWSRAMRQNNGTIVLAALLLDPANTMYNLQLERVVRCAGKPGRRVFDDVDELRGWVGEALTPPEREALDDLFSRGTRFLAPSRSSPTPASLRVDAAR